MKIISKKVLSMVLAISLVLTMIPVFASAETTGIGWSYLGQAGISEIDNTMSPALSMAVDSGNVPYVAFEVNQSAVVMKYSDSAWKTLGEKSASETLSGVSSVSMAVSDSGTPYVGYSYIANNKYHLMVKKYTEAGGWEPVGQLDNIHSLNPSIAIDADGTPYVTFNDVDHNGATVMRYTEGSGWNTVGTPGFSDDIPVYTSIAVDSGHVPYVVYKNLRNKLFVEKYTQAGWQTAGTSFPTESLSYPLIKMAKNGTPYVTYIDSTKHNPFVVTLEDGAWKVLGGAVSDHWTDSISMALAEDGTPYVAYKDNSLENNAAVKKYNYSSGTWEAVGNPAITRKGIGSFTSMAVDGDGTPYVAFYDYASESKLSVKKYGPAAEETITYSAGNHGSIAAEAGSENVITGDCPVAVPAVTPDSGYAFTGWSSDGGKTVLTNEQLQNQVITADVTFTACYSNSFWEDVGTPDFTLGKANNLSSVMDKNGSVYVAYDDPNNGNTVSVMKYSPESNEWKLLGKSFPKSENNYSPSIALDSKGTPYVAYNECNIGKATVVKYTGNGTTGWETVGSEGFSDSVAYFSLTIDSSDTPYLAYADMDKEFKAAVMKYTGKTESGWESVGTTGFSEGRAYDLTFAVSPNSMPYVAYQDTANHGKATVMKYTGTDWEPVGTAGFSYGMISSISLAVDKNGTPYVGYDVGGYGLMLAASGSNESCVMKFTGVTEANPTGWESVGSTGFADCYTSDSRIAVDSGGTLYVAYRDDNSSQKLTVKKYDGANWVNVGNAGFSAGHIVYMSLMLRGGTPYVAYGDMANNYKATVKRFVTNLYTVTYQAGAHGSGSGSETVAPNECPKSVPTATPDADYTFQGWSCDGGQTFLTSAQLETMKINANVTYTAYFLDNSKKVPVTGVTLNPSSMTLAAGGASGTLTATVAPVDATNKNVTWSSGNSGVASVSNGVVTPLAAGTAVITVTTADGGKTASCTVTVTAAGGSSDKHSGGSDTKAPSYNDVTKVDPFGNTVTVTPKADRVSVNGNTADIETVITNITTDDTGTSTNGSVADTAKKTAVTINVPTDAVKQQLAAKKNVELIVTVPSEVAKDTNPNLAVNINANKEILQAAKENRTDVTIQVKNTDTQQLAYSWTFKGEDLAKSSVPVKDVNISMSVHLTTEVNKVNAVTPGSKGLVLSFDYSGLLPSVASVKISALEKGFKPGQTLYFYYYNPTTKQIEPLDKNAYVVDADGNVTVQISHCSDYVLLPNAARSLVLDTKNYTTATKDRYEIGVKLTGTKGCTMKVYSSTKGIASIARLKNGNYQVIGLQTGLTYIMFDVYDEKGKLISKAHASVRLTVEKGVKPSGDSHRQTALF
jgi:Bacterial surface proteins containing Ig-like domains